MFFVKVADIEYASTYTDIYNKTLISKGLFNFYKILVYSFNNSKLSYYLICSQYNRIIIIHSYLVVSLVNGQYVYINYIHSSKSMIIFKSLNPALLILSIYSLFYCTSMRILILEVNSCNLDALSLYYWSGFQLINRRYNYYSNYNDYYLYNTAYTLVNTKFLGKNILRRYVL